ncbi:MAG: type II toxin-antitoxin system Phd/YefM family antitoxin [Roseburia sp.]|nr:type II toxin-antitoxin system Phd/YefM family antitoxin [Roseburia sp.]
MTIDTNTMISITEANQNFSKVAKVVDEHGTAVILKNNVPRYLVIDFSQAENFLIGEKEKFAGDEDVFAISERLIKQNMEAYEVLAK